MTSQKRFMTNLPTIVITGDENSGKRFVASAILDGCSVDEECLEIPHVISTKYYSAKTLLKIIPFSELNVSSLENCHAFVYVWNGQTHSPNQILSQLENLSSQIRSSSEMFGDIRLCVGNRSESVQEPIQDWCLDNGFEWVHVVQGDTVEGVELSNDPVGLSRIQQAISSSMWPGMQMTLFNNESDIVEMMTSLESDDTETVDAGNNDIGHTEDHEEDEFKLDELEGMIQKILHIRNMQVSGDEKKVLAAEAAAEMWEMFFAEEGEDMPNLSDL